MFQEVEHLVSLSMTLSATIVACELRNSLVEECSEVFPVGLLLSVEEDEVVSVRESGNDFESISAVDLGFDSCGVEIALRFLGHRFEELDGVERNSCGSEV